MSEHQLWLLLNALDRLRYIYPDSVSKYADSLLRIAEAIGLKDGDEDPDTP